MGPLHGLTITKQRRGSNFAANDGSNFRQLPLIPNKRPVLHCARRGLGHSFRIARAQLDPLPETVCGLYKQRVRWAQDGIQVLVVLCDDGLTGITSTAKSTIQPMDRGVVTLFWTAQGGRSCGTGHLTARLCGRTRRSRPPCHGRSPRLPKAKCGRRWEFSQIWLSRASTRRQ